MKKGSVAENIALELNKYIWILDLSFISFMDLAKSTEPSEPEQQSNVDAKINMYIPVQGIMKIHCNCGMPNKWCLIYLTSVH